MRVEAMTVVATRGASLILAVLLGITVGACDRTHLGDSHGRAFREVFARQAVNPNAGAKPRSAKVFQGLDSQEAAIVAQTYRKGLSPKESTAGREGQMLLMAPGGASPREGSNMPPPSVPDR